MRGYHFPCANRRILYRSIRSVRRCGLGVLRGKGRIWCTRQPALPGEPRPDRADQAGRAEPRPGDGSCRPPSARTTPTRSKPASARTRSSLRTRRARTAQSPEVSPPDRGDHRGRSGGSDRVRAARSGRAVGRSPLWPGAGAEREGRPRDLDLAMHCQSAFAVGVGRRDSPDEADESLLGSPLLADRSRSAPSSCRKGRAPLAREFETIAVANERDDFRRCSPPGRRQVSECLSGHVRLTVLDQPAQRLPQGLQRGVPRGVPQDRSGALDAGGDTAFDVIQRHRGVF